MGLVLSPEMHKNALATICVDTVLFAHSVADTDVF